MKLYFDTSAINAIAHDPSGKELVEKLKSIHETYISIYNVVEIVSTSDSAERLKLLELAQDLASGFYPLAHPRDILKRALEAFQHKLPEMNFSISDEDHGVWIALNKPDKVGEEDRIDVLHWKQREESWYQNMHNKGRPHIKDVIKKLSQTDRLLIQRSNSSFLRYLMQNKQLLVDSISSLVDSQDFSGREIEVVNALEPWRFYLGAIALGIYNRSIKNSEFSRKRNAGGIDTQQAVYLAATDVFVTNDWPQRKVLRMIKLLGHVKRYVWSYKRLKTTLGF